MNEKQTFWFGIFIFSIAYTIVYSIENNWAEIVSFIVSVISFMGMVQTSEEGLS